MSTCSDKLETAVIVYNFDDSKNWHSFILKTLQHYFVFNDVIVRFANNMNYVFQNQLKQIVSLENMILSTF